MTINKYQAILLTICFVVITTTGVYGVSSYQAYEGYDQNCEGNGGSAYRHCRKALVKQRIDNKVLPLVLGAQIGLALITFFILKKYDKKS
jgi:hypothetical protein